MPEPIRSAPADPAVTPVLLYHDVTRGVPDSPWQITVAELAAQLDAVVASGRTALTATALDAELAGGSAPARPLCAVTFDDGHASFAELALPLLVERHLPATLYVTTDYLRRPGMLSGAALRDLAGTPPEICTPGETGTPGETDTPRETGTPGRTGTPGQTGKPGQTGTLVEIGAHSVHHVHLDLHPATAAAEVRDCRTRLADLLGEAPASFAYPHGSFDRHVRTAVTNAGYANAYAVKNALTHADDDRHARARLTVLAATPRATVDRWGEAGSSCSASTAVESVTA